MTAAVHDLLLADGRTLRVHDSESAGRIALTVLWHHGSPQTGEPLEPLVRAATARGIRLLSYARPGYGGSSPHPGRTVGDAASDVAQLAVALDVDHLGMLAASGGGPHALACAALLPDLVPATATLAGIAPYAAHGGGLDWFAGMADGGAALRSALEGRAARERHEQTSEFEPASFTPGDYAALDGEWSSLGDDVGRAMTAGGAVGLIDDDLAFVASWGFEPHDIATPVLLVQGDDDRVVPPAHARWMLDRLDDGELWVRPRDGHVAVLNAAPVALDWLLQHAWR